MIYFFVLLMTLAGSLGAFFFKKSTEKMAGIFSLLHIPAFYLGGCLYVLGALMNVVLLRFMDYTVLYPMSAIAYIWSLVISNLFLGENHKEKGAGHRTDLSGRFSADQVREGQSWR